MPSENISNPLESLESDPITNPIMTKIRVTSNSVTQVPFDSLSRGVFFFYRDTLHVKTGSSTVLSLQDNHTLMVMAGEFHYMGELTEKVTVVGSIKIHATVT
jgi:hypothetical protein